MMFNVVRIKIVIGYNVYWHLSKIVANKFQDCKEMSSDCFVADLFNVKKFAHRHVYKKKFICGGVHNSFQGVL